MKAPDPGSARLASVKPSHAVRSSGQAATAARVANIGTRKSQAVRARALAALQRTLDRLSRNGRW